jgi:hypothetical protein
MTAEAAKPDRSLPPSARRLDDPVEQVVRAVLNELLCEPSRNSAIDVVVHADCPFATTGSRSSASIAERIV